VDWLEYAGPFETLVEGEAPVAVKTHELPTDDAPTIYVMRDGRAVIVSYFHYQNDFGYPTEIGPLIAGNVWPGSWSKHVEAWMRPRPRLLPVRYEDLKADPQSQIDRIAYFLGVPQIAPYQNRFAELHERNPKLYRAGDNKRNISELDQFHANLFLEHHGPLMRELGYV
jgi:hypothetical protein